MVTVGVGQLAKRSGYRRYDDKGQTRLRFIRRAKARGFTLDEIRALLSLSAGRNMEQIRSAASARLADVERRIQRRLPRPRPRGKKCPILHALTGDEK